MVKQFTEIPINRSLLEEKKLNRFEFYRTVRYFCTTISSSLSCIRKSGFPKKKMSEIDHIFLPYRKISKSESCFYFPPMAVPHVRINFYPKTPIDTLGRPLTPEDTLCIVKKSFILFFMIYYHEVIPFLVYITVSHSRRCTFYNSY